LVYIFNEKIIDFIKKKIKLDKRDKDLFFNIFEELRIKNIMLKVNKVLTKFYVKENRKESKCKSVPFKIYGFLNGFDLKDDTDYKKEFIDYWLDRIVIEKKGKKRAIKHNEYEQKHKYSDRLLSTLNQKLYEESIAQHKLNVVKALGLRNPNMILKAEVSANYYFSWSYFYKWNLKRLKIRLPLYYRRKPVPNLEIHDPYKPYKDAFLAENDIDPDLSIPFEKHLDALSRFYSGWSKKESRIIHAENFKPEWQPSFFRKQDLFKSFSGDNVLETNVFDSNFLESKLEINASEYKDKANFFSKLIKLNTKVLNNVEQIRELSKKKKRIVSISSFLNKGSSYFTKRSFIKDFFVKESLITNNKHFYKMPSLSKSVFEDGVVVKYNKDGELSMLEPSSGIFIKSRNIILNSKKKYFKESILSRIRKEKIDIFKGSLLERHNEFWKSLLVLTSDDEKKAKRQYLNKILSYEKKKNKVFARIKRYIFESRITRLRNSTSFNENFHFLKKLKKFKKFDRLYYYFNFNNRTYFVNINEFEFLLLKYRRLIKNLDYPQVKYIFDIEEDPYMTDKLKRLKKNKIDPTWKRKSFIKSTFKRDDFNKVFLNFIDFNYVYGVVDYTLDNILLLNNNDIFYFLLNLMLC